MNTNLNGRSYIFSLQHKTDKTGGGEEGGKIPVYKGRVYDVFLD